jgi:hypothetical protein
MDWKSLSLPQPAMYSTMMVTMGKRSERRLLEGGDRDDDDDGGAPGWQQSISEFSWTETFLPSIMYCFHL